MADITAIYDQTITSYQRPEDFNFPVSKIRLFMDVLWQGVTGKPLTDDQKATLKQIIDLLNLLDEHKHQSEKELIAAMLPAISPLLTKMPTLGLTGTHVFAHLVPIYQLYLPSVEQMVKDAHPFTLEETLFYYLATIFDHLFLVHIFEQEPNLNMIEMLLTIKAIILTNALVYDYQQHTSGRSISFFTFLMRGGLTGEQLLPFLTEAVTKVKEEAKQTVTNPACLETLEFLTTKLMDTTKTPATDVDTNETKEVQDLEKVMQPATPPEEVDKVFNEVTETPVDPTASDVAATTAPVEKPVETTVLTPEIPAPETAPTTPVSEGPTTPTAAPLPTPEPIVTVPPEPPAPIAPPREPRT